MWDSYLDDVYWEGVDDCYFGFWRCENPYYEWSDSYASWDDGWFDCYYGIW